MEVIAAVSAKGEMGKTTVSVDPSAALSRAERDILAIDPYPQNAVALYLKAWLERITRGRRQVPVDWQDKPGEFANMILLLGAGERQMPVANECATGQSRRIGEQCGQGDVIGSTGCRFALPRAGRAQWHAGKNCCSSPTGWSGDGLTPAFPSSCIE